jgi:hypothetical protein
MTSVTGGPSTPAPRKSQVQRNTLERRCHAVTPLLVCQLTAVKSYSPDFGLKSLLLYKQLLSEVAQSRLLKASHGPFESP